MSLGKKEIFEFGEYRLDVDEHTVERIDGTRNGTLTEKAFQTLVLLVRRRGHLVSKDELIRFVWPDTIVEDNNLEKCVHHLRHFLGETSEGSIYIETVRKHGYRFIGKVETIEVSSSWLPETFRTAYEQSAPAGTIADQLTELEAESEKTVGTVPARVEKARYPFRSSLMIPAIILALTGGLAVLGYYLRADVAANENRLLARFGSHAIEFQSQRGTNNEEARRFYLMAVNIGEERGIQNVLKSLEYLERAVALDPNYAHAWAGLALIHNDIVQHTDSGQQEHYQRSMDAIGKALAIDPNMSEAYSALCNNKNGYEYDITGAETACKRALELDPNSPVAHKTYAKFLYSRGRFDEAIVEIKTAMDLQPVSYRNQQIYALTLYFARRYNESEQQFKRLVELNPNQSDFIQERLVKVLEQQGKESEAFDSLVKTSTIQNSGNGQLERFKTAYQTSGWRGVVTEQIKTAEADGSKSYFQRACLNAKIGNKDKAFEDLEKAYAERSFQMAILQVEPQLDSLRGDPRYHELLRRVESNG